MIRILLTIIGIMFLIYIATVLYFVIVIKTIKFGILHIDTSDPIKDKYNFEVTKDLNDLPKHKRVIFEVSQEKHFL